MKIRHLVLPMAGAGKRLLPLTLRRPKPLVPAHGEPLLRYVLEETKGSGIREVICVVSPSHKGQFERYLRSAKRDLPRLTFHVKIQEELLGDGHAVLHAYDIVKGNPFAVRFSDDLLFHERPQLQSLIDAYGTLKAPVMLLERMPDRLVGNYGAVGGVKTGAHQGGALYRLTTIVEKPPLGEAPSNLTIVGGYVLPPRILADLKKTFDAMRERTKDALRLTRIFARYCAEGKNIYGWEFPGTRLDCGTMEGFERAEQFLKKRNA